jgi:hypothetical protein
MPKKRARSETTKPDRTHRVSVRRPTVTAHAERKAGSMKLTEVKPGLFLNEDQIVSVRVLPQEEENVYAVLHLSNGDKQNLTRAEFTAITGEVPRGPVRAPHTPESR